MKISNTLFLNACFFLASAVANASELCTEEVLKFESNPYYDIMELEVNDFKTEKELLELKILALDNQKKILPFSVTATYTAGDNSVVSDFPSGTITQNSSISSQLDLNGWNRDLADQVIDIEIKNLALELAKIESDEKQVILLAFIDVWESEELKSIFLKKLSVLEKNLAYYEIRNSMGDVDVDGLRTINQSIQELKDKLFSNQIRLLEKISYLSIDKNKLHSGGKISMEKLVITDPTCKHNLYHQKISELEFQLLNIEKSRFDFLNSLQISSNLDLKQQLLEGNTTNQLSINLTLSKSIFDGGLRKNQEQDFLHKINSKTREIARNKTKDAEIIRTRIQTEKVFIKSIKSLKSQKNENIKKIEEFNSRNSLGQSVFLEKTNAHIEYYNTVETILRLKADYLRGKVKFLKMRDSSRKEYIEN